MSAARQALEPIVTALTDLADRDTAAFDAVMAAYRLPKATEQEKAARSQAIQAALRGATDVPLATLRAYVRAIEHGRVVQDYGNPSADSDVGVAMGLSGSDIATNSAGVALMNDDLRHIPFLLELARKARSVMSLNIIVSLLLALVGLALAATGNINIWFSPIYYSLGYVFVIANSLRLVRFGEDFTHAEEARRRMEASKAVKPTRTKQFATT